MSGFAPGTFSLYIKEIAFFFFLFLDVCSIKQLHNLKKKNKTTKKTKTSLTHTKKTKNKLAIVYCQITDQKKKNETAEFHFSTQLSQEFPPSEESPNETQNAKKRCTLNIIMCVNKCKCCLLHAAYAFVVVWAG